MTPWTAEVRVTSEPIDFDSPWKEILEHLGLPTTGPPVAPGLPLHAKTPSGRTTYRSCSKRCADGGGQLCAYALISPCAPGCSAPPPRLVAEDGMREEGRGDRTALIRPLALRLAVNARRPRGPCG